MEGVSKMQFQIKGQEFFLTFAEDEKTLYVVTPTEDGVHKIPVYVDVEKWERIGGWEKRTPRVQ